MRKSTKKFLISLNPKAEEQGLTRFVEFTDKELVEPERVFFAEELEKHIDEKMKHVTDWMCKEGYFPCADNWRLVSPHWYKTNDTSGTRFSFDDIYKLYILTHESK